MSYGSRLLDASFRHGGRRHGQAVEDVRQFGAVAAGFGVEDDQG
ncbi:hypothetical protein [Streptomyces actinomycinicus]|nr:hypothetical protein [Streptomyces actinomycinicus]